MLPTESYPFVPPIMVCYIEAHFVCHSFDEMEQLNKHMQNIGTGALVGFRLLEINSISAQRSLNPLLKASLSPASCSPAGVARQLELAATQRSGLGFS